MKRGVIYKLTNLINGKMYFGQTIQDPVKRWHRHKRSTKSAIGMAILKYGPENFKLEIVCSAYTIEDLNVLEAYFIRTYNTMAPNGYNLDEGGRNCLKTKESIEKGAIKKRGKAYKGRRRGVVAIHSKNWSIIEKEVVKDFQQLGFSKSDCNNIRTVLCKKFSKKRVKKYFFYYKDQVNQNLIVELKKSAAVQRIGNKTAKQNNSPRDLNSEGNSDE